MAKIRNISVDNKYLDKIIQAVFLFLIVVLGNFVVSTLNCNIQTILTNNYIVKNLIIIIIIYFAIDLHDNLDLDNPVIHPFNTLGITLVAWLAFILFSNINIYLALVIFGLLVFSYSIDRYIKYYKSLLGDKFLDKNLTHIKEILYIIIFVLLFIGIIGYFLENSHKKNRNHKSSFINLFKFYQKCRINPR